MWDFINYKIAIKQLGDKKENMTKKSYLLHEYSTLKKCKFFID